MGEINHFSHKEHPLKLIEDWETVVAAAAGVGDDEEKKDVVNCGGCQEPISGGGSAYGCISCGYYLHKKCAELPLTINHRSHLLHPLPLIVNTYYDARCVVCDDKNLVMGCFIYCCFDCRFAACVKCGIVFVAQEAAAVALKKEASIKLTLEGHHRHKHKLTLQLRSAAFDCDACHSKDEGLFYACDSCDFWIHKSCTSLALILDLPHHPKHPLVLAYSLPENFHKFNFGCEFCKKRIIPNDWLYHCANCRYFAHIKCALNAEHQPSTTRDGPVVEEEEEELKDLLHFPTSEAFTNPLKHSHHKIAHHDPHDDDETTTEIHSHWSHPQHPLILNYVESPQGDINNNMPNSNSAAGSSDHPIEVCYACVRPLSLPYYTCTQHGCSFSLHKYCSQLPRTLQHQLHPDHLLHLVETSEYGYRCTGCYSWGNTFVYKCTKTCKFYLDVNCAFLPNTIKHESHNHPLTQLIDPKPPCKACYRSSGGMISYACKDNRCDFRLDMYCALRSPRSLSHRFCKGHEIYPIDVSTG